MVDARVKKDQLRSALTSQDPNAVARALVLPPIAPTHQKGTEPKTHNPQSLTVNEIDYGAMLTSLLDACAAAESVSFLSLCSTYIMACQLTDVFFLFRCV